MADSTGSESFSTEIKGGRPRLSLKRKKKDGDGTSKINLSKKTSNLVPPKLKSIVIQNLKNIRSKDSVDAKTTGKLDSRSTLCGEDSSDQCDKEPSDGGGEDPNEEEQRHLFICPMCQRDLTHFSSVRRQQHINRCCEASSNSIVGEMEQQQQQQQQGNYKTESLLCVICQKKFSNEQVKNTHLKSCAKKNGVLTAKLLDTLNHSEESEVFAESQVSLRDVDFQIRPPSLPVRRSRKRKKLASQLGSLQDIEDEQLQLGLALSASLNGGVTPDSGDTILKPRARRRKHLKLEVERGQHPLLTATTQQARDIIAIRADKLMTSSSAGTANNNMNSEDIIPCTPAFGSSCLGQELNLRESGAKSHPPDAAEDDVLFASDEEEDREDDMPIQMDDADPSMNLSMLLDHHPEVKMDVGVIMEAGGSGGGSGSSGGGEFLKTSCISELKDLAYPTLWQLGSRGLTPSSMSDFYVPALSEVVSPSKTNPLACGRCSTETCLIACSTSHSVPHPQPQPRASDCVNVSKCSGNGVDSLVSDLRSMINSSFLGDVTILAHDGSRIRAHSFMLAARCPGFRQAISNNPSSSSRSLSWVVDMSEFSHNSVLGYLEHVYTGSMKTSLLEDVRTFEAISLRMSTGNEASKYITSGENLRKLPEVECESLPVDHDSIPADCDSIVADRYSIPADCDSIPADCDSIPADRDSIPADCDSIPADCDSIPADCDSIPADCDSIPADHDSIPADRDSIPADCDSVPADRDSIVADRYSIVADRDSIPADDPIYADSDPISTNGSVVCDETGSICKSPESEEEILISLSNSGSSSDVVITSIVPSQQDPFADEESDDIQEVTLLSPGSKRGEEEIKVSNDEDLLTVVGIERNNSIDEFEDMATQTTPSTPPSEHTCHGSVTLLPIVPPTPPIRVQSCDVTPAGDHVGLLSDDNITPMPDYLNMHTPFLKDQCSRFGMRVLPKRKMISKLKEIYTYTHPLVAEDGAVIPEVEVVGQECANKNNPTKKPRALSSNKTQEDDKESVKQRVIDAIGSNEELYEDVLLYKPLEISILQARLKSVGVSLAKERLAEVLDFLNLGEILNKLHNIFHSTLISADQ